MALYTRKGREIPGDAVELSETEAVEFMRNITSSWSNAGEVFYLNYGAGLLSGLTAMTGIYLNNYFRMRLRLQSFGRVSTYLPVVIIPSISVFIAHNKRVLDPVLINKFTCPVCLEIRSVSWQLALGLLYPLTLAPFSTFAMALRHHTYHVPDLTRDPKSMWLVFKKMVRPIKVPLLALVGLHFSAASFIAYKESENVYYINEKLAKMEDAILNK